MCNILQIVVCPFVLFLLPIVLSVLQFTDSDYPFGIFKLFCQMIISSIKMNCSLVHSRQLILYVKLHLNQIKGCTHSCRQIRQQQVYFWHLWASCLETDMVRTLKIYINLYSVPRIILSEFQKEQTNRP
jgi:hypothetical protein